MTPKLKKEILNKYYAYLGKKYERSGSLLGFTCLFIGFQYPKLASKFGKFLVDSKILPTENNNIAITYFKESYTEEYNPAHEEAATFRLMVLEAFCDKLIKEKK